MTVIVKYFAALRDERGVDEETLEGTFTSPKDVYLYLKEKHGLSMCTSKLKVAINDDFSGWDALLNDGDNLVFIPPVAGG